eukprot:TRINITY_DN1701_c0_g1_i1.p1 TRINITY_DN1701_c0_g1~~TRINITY_DN1701_c0_g1_i1.p1  ORF type:complete len:115 (+),score=16.46 TRINITY_DN1701_c0_g1_i1:47-391(+)
MAGARGETMWLLRSLIRQVDRQITRVNNNNTWRQYILDQFRLNKSVTEKEASRFRNVAEAYLAVLTTVGEQQVMWKKYNITPFKTADRLHKEAARAGLQLPHAHGVHLNMGKNL